MSHKARYVNWFILAKGALNFLSSRGCPVAISRGKKPTSRYKSARIFKRDAIPFVQRLGVDSYDIAFADPPYGSRKLDRILEEHRNFKAPLASITKLT